MVRRTHYVEASRQNKATCSHEHQEEKNSTVREQPHRMCKSISSKINCKSAIGQHLRTTPECAKTYTDDNFRIIVEARSSFHLGALESVYIKTPNPVLCRQKSFYFR